MDNNFILLPLSKFEELTKKLDELKFLIQDNIGYSQRIDDWIPEKEAQQLLGLKATSLWALRKQGLIKYSKVGSKTFYSLKSIAKLLNKNQE
jgi:hypothetical protein